MSTKSALKLVKVITALLAVVICVLGFSISLTNDRAPVGTGINTYIPPRETKPDEQPSSGHTTDAGTDSQQPVTPRPDDDGYIDYLASGGKFELPVSGATGFATIPTDILSEASDAAEKVGSLKGGDSFCIIRESGEWWRIRVDNTEGWLRHKYCFINLPDIIPSIVYYDTNSFSSVFVSSGYEIAGVTGQQLYEVYEYNERLGKDEYTMPVLYSMAPKICAAQQAALELANTLIIYETYRPREVQKKVANLLSLLASINDEVKRGISTSPWSITWFISTGISNHQRGYAFDVSLGKVNRIKTNTTGGYKYTEVTSYTECVMPTEMHELSMAAISMTTAVSSSSDTAWRKVKVADTMTESSLLLRQICTDAGMSPLASEWWHFNDLETAKLVAGSTNSGNFYLSSVRSVSPAVE